MTELYDALRSSYRTTAHNRKRVDLIPPRIQQRLNLKGMTSLSEPSAPAHTVCGEVVLRFSLKFFLPSLCEMLHHSKLCILYKRFFLKMSHLHKLTRISEIKRPLIT